MRRSNVHRIRIYKCQVEVATSLSRHRCRFGGDDVTRALKAAILTRSREKADTGGSERSPSWPSTPRYRSTTSSMLVSWIVVLAIFASSICGQWSSRPSRPTAVHQWVRSGLSAESVSEPHRHVMQDKLFRASSRPRCASCDGSCIPAWDEPEAVDVAAGVSDDSGDLFARSHRNDLLRELAELTHRQSRRHAIRFAGIGSERSQAHVAARPTCSTPTQARSWTSTSRASAHNGYLINHQRRCTGRRDGLLFGQVSSPSQTARNMGQMSSSNAAIALQRNGSSGQCKRSQIAATTSESFQIPRPTSCHCALHDPLSACGGTGACRRFGATDVEHWHMSPTAACSRQLG